MYDDKNVMSVMAKSRMPVDRWVATISGCSRVFTTSMPRTICTDTTIAAINAVFRAGVAFLIAKAAVAKMRPAVITTITR